MNCEEGFNITFASEIEAIGSQCLAPTPVGNAPVGGDTNVNSALSSSAKPTRASNSGSVSTKLVTAQEKGMGIAVVIVLLSCFLAVFI